MELVDGIVCPVCESSNLKVVNCDVEFSYKTVRVIFGDVPVYKCGNTPSGCEGEFIEPTYQRFLDSVLTRLRVEYDKTFTLEENND